MEKNLTALMSAFVRSYHIKNSNIKVYYDKYADKIITTEEYNLIKENLTNGMSFFEIDENAIDKLTWIVNKRMGQTVLGRSAFNKRALDNAIKLGCKQYLVYASGYDTSTLSCNIKSFEIDRPEMIDDKIKRLNNLNNNIEFIKADFQDNNWINNIVKSSYNKNLISFNSLLGISYYLTKDEFKNMLLSISNIIKEGSTIIFDYETNNESIESTLNKKLASSAGEKMKAKYCYKEIEKILEECNLKIYEHLDAKNITKEFFYDYNTLNPNLKIIMPDNIAFLLAVKK